MKKITIAVCEEKDTYRERLTEYFIRRKGEQVQIYTFSARRPYQEKRKEVVFDIILLGGGFQELYGKGDKRSLQIVLSENRGEIKENIPVIFKYQSAEEIMRSMFAYYMELQKKDTYVSENEKEIIGIYSPSHSSLQTPFALTLAQMLSQEKKILYVNLGEWAGLGKWFCESYQRDLADLIYMLSNEQEYVKGTLECVLHTMNRMDYIPPMEDAQLLCQTEEEEYLALLKLLVEKTDYEIIILDFGVMIPGFFSLLDKCNSIYGVTEDGIMPRGQCSQFEDSLMKAGMEYLAEKISYVTFSVGDVDILKREPVLQQWLYGELGDRARAARYGQDGRNQNLCYG